MATHPDPPPQEGRRAAGGVDPPPQEVHRAAGGKGPSMAKIFAASRRKYQALDGAMASKIAPPLLFLAGL
jgi:hypothetical protein